MVRNSRYHPVGEASSRPIIAFTNDYPDDFEITPHHHDRGQFLHGGFGVMTVRTEHGAWVVPPQEAVWIPAGIATAMLAAV